MIYLDSSVLLAQLLAEGRRPETTFWRRRPFVSSRLLEYEVWNRVNARGLEESLGPTVRSTLERVSLLELVPPVLSRALEAFPIPVRTLDGLHLASMEFLRQAGQAPELATYNLRLADAASAMGIPIVDL